ncbi:hypothetical protein T265_07032 [Opisthorchis viverrini]|uniref:Uncharacterized protein n=1 Tax=Opisthorchis viverrini TaxID=6198 RepID=A0A075ACL6_OPIVI|nr:hypothetical protein T265_07032 [Opisthorchis viverrini]KER25514.1 hypothetical protein T265_07032 [Opisthorchis viverrini]
MHQVFDRRCLRPVDRVRGHHCIGNAESLMDKRVEENKQFNGFECPSELQAFTLCYPIFDNASKLRKPFPNFRHYQSLPMVTRMLPT